MSDDERQVPAHGTADRKLDSRGSRDDYLTGRRLSEVKGKRGQRLAVADHDAVLRARTRYVVMFHHGPPSGSRDALGLASAGSVERAKACGDRYPERAPAYVLDVCTGRCFDVWGEAAAMGPIE